MATIHGSVAQGEPLERPRLRPGEYPEHLFHEPFPAPVVETSEEFREKYLFGDWLGARSELAAQGIKPLVLLIIDPFVNASGGRRRGLANTTCSPSTSSWRLTSSWAGTARILIRIVSPPYTTPG
jgi:hypothetical protein